MTPILQYFLKLSISLSVVYLFYQLVLRRLTFYNWNRWYLVSYSLLSFFIPFVDISLVLDKNEWSSSAIVQWLPTFQTNNSHSAGVYSSPTLLSPTDIIQFALVVGMLIMFCRLIVQLLSFRKMINNASIIPVNGLKLYQVNDKIIPFSFGNSIFINRSLHNDQELREIILHEFVHVKQRHSVDIIWSELLCLVNWYNPFAWLIRRAIRQNLEFIADNQVLENGIDRKQYQYLLLKVIGNNHFSIASKFNFSSLKKRIAMMNKMKSAGVHLVKFLFILPLVAVLLVAFRNKYDKQLQFQLSKNTVLSQPGLREARLIPAVVLDTVPESGTVNDKGYQIDIKGVNGNCTPVPPTPPTDPESPTPPIDPVPAEAPVPPVPPTKCCSECPSVYSVAPVAIGYGFGIGTGVGIAVGTTTSVNPAMASASNMAAMTTAQGKTIIAPMSPRPGVGVTIVDDYGYNITGKEDVLVKITKNTTREELEQYKIKMKEKGIELTFDEIKFNQKGKLIYISGHMKSNDGQSNFNASDFEILTLAMVRKDDQSFFKVNIQGDKEVI